MFLKSIWGTSTSIDTTLTMSNPRMSDGRYLDGENSKFSIHLNQRKVQVPGEMMSEERIQPLYVYYVVNLSEEHCRILRIKTRK